MRFVLSISLALALTLACAGLARADASPFPGPPETCTEIKKEQPGTDCEVCYPVWGDDDSAESCQDQLAGTGFHYVCTQSDWQGAEVWCDGPARQTACALDAGATPSAVLIGVFGGLAALGIAVLGRRRR